MLAEEGAAIEVVYASHYARLERELTSITRDPDDGREFAAEAFARLSHEIAAGRSPTNPPAWLRRVGTNLAWSRGRHRSVEGRRMAELPTPRGPELPEAIVILAEMWRELEREIKGLAPSERRAVALAANGYDSAEIGAALGRTPGAVRTLLCRTRAKLRRRLEGSGHVLAVCVMSFASDESLLSLLPL